MDSRAGASGPFSLPVTVQRLAWDALANLALTVLPAGHSRGNYDLIASLAVQVASPSGGLAQIEVRWNDGGVPQVLQFISPASIAFGLAGPQSNYPIGIHSDGSAPIVLEFQPAGVSAPCSVDVNCSATQVSRG